jgi:hypothetical protein
MFSHAHDSGIIIPMLHIFMLGSKDLCGCKRLAVIMSLGCPT